MSAGPGSFHDLARRPTRRGREGRSMPNRSPPAFLRVMTIVTGLCGIVLLLAGGWLAAIGGSLYYVVASLFFLATALLLHRMRPEALSVFAVLVVGTLIWALYEVGFDWWPLAARGDVVVIVGALLLLPWVVRPLGRPTVEETLEGRERRLSPLHGHGAFLSATLLMAVVVAGASWFTDLHRKEGTLPGTRLGAGDGGVPEGEWLAYGRSQMGQRYSPLADITPANVSSLEQAWSFQTGDLPRPGDPEETTFQVTPLKIGERLYLCTPHQNVIALDATTGATIWRYDPVIQGELALQHLTCRGLSYQSAEAAAAAGPQAGASPAPRPRAPRLRRRARRRPSPPKAALPPLRRGRPRRRRPPARRWTRPAATRTPACRSPSPTPRPRPATTSSLCRRPTGASSSSTRNGGGLLQCRRRRRADRPVGPDAQRQSGLLLLDLAGDRGGQPRHRRRHGARQRFDGRSVRRHPRLRHHDGRPPLELGFGQAQRHAADRGRADLYAEQPEFLVDHERRRRARPRLRAARQPAPGPVGRQPLA